MDYLGGYFISGRIKRIFGAAEQELAMSEPENHTLRLLREFREEFREFRTEAHRSFGEVNERIDNLARMLAGESVLGRYAAAGVEERLTSIEKRVSALEEAR